MSFQWNMLERKIDKILKGVQCPKKDREWRGKPRRNQLLQPSEGFCLILGPHH